MGKPSGGRPGRSSSAKKVAKAARTGGGRTASRGKRNTPWGWYSAMGVVVLLLFVVLVTSVQSANDAGGEPPQLFSSHPEDHWHIAYGIDLCGKWMPDLPQPAE